MLTDANPGSAVSVAFQHEPAVAGAVEPLFGELRDQLDCRDAVVAPQKHAQIEDRHGTTRSHKQTNHTVSSPGIWTSK